jgi:hypothetical protein
MADRLFTPSPEHVKVCAKCGASITHAYSFKTGRPYPVNMRADGQADRTSFHSKTCVAKPSVQAAPAPVAPVVQPAPVAPPAAKVSGAAGYPNDILTDLLGNDWLAHAAFEQYLRNNKADIVAGLHEIFHRSDSFNKSGKLAVLDKPAPAAPPVAAPAPVAKPAAQVSGAVKMGEYLCNNSDCQEVNFTLEVKPGKPNCCPACKRILLFKGLSVD